jgi:hypothetical protein
VDEKNQMCMAKHLHFGLNQCTVQVVDDVVMWIMWVQQFAHGVMT